MIARMIRDRPADFISLCVGINMHGGSVGPRAFLPAIIGFVQIIREKHPHTPILLISPIYSQPREDEINAAGWTLPLMREEVEAAFRTLREFGDAHIHYLNGLDLLGPQFQHLLPDKLHPNGEGYQQMARNFVDNTRASFFGR
jgi:lysophospholipase L1-like esterase